MEVFLDKVVNTLIDKFKGNYSDLTIVVPNKRAVSMLVQILAIKANGKPVMLPRVITLFNYVESAANVRLINVNVAVARLYNLFKEYGLLKEKETFSNFSAWGRILLDDFGNIDLALADPEKVFGNIGQQKDIDQRFGPDLTDEQKNAFENYFASIYQTKTSKSDTKSEYNNGAEEVVKYWENLKKVYLKFHEKNPTESYYGKLAKIVSEDLPVSLNKTTYFIGLYGLAPAELNIIEKALALNADSDCIWDILPSYLQADFAANWFFDKIKKGKHSHIKASINANVTKITTSAFQLPIITTIGAVGTTAQARVASQIIAKLEITKEGLPNTALVLPKVSNLIPVLSNLPDNIGGINISIPLELKSTPILDLLKLIAALRLEVIADAKVYSPTNLDTIAYHQGWGRFNTYINTYRDQLYKSKENGRPLKAISYITLADANINPFHFIANKPSNNDSEFGVINQLLSLLSKSYLKPEINKDQRNKTSNGIEAENFYQIAKCYQSMKNFLETEHVLSNESPSEIWAIFLENLDNVQFNVSGDPLSGLQIIGKQETRAINVENLIIIDANEGSFPAAYSNRSFIPYNLRLAFGISAQRESDAAEAYLFFRQIPYAKQIYLIHNVSQTSSLDRIEPSRFFAQLKNLGWLKDENQKTATENSPAITKVPPLVAKYEPSIQSETLKVSPSNLRNFLECELKYNFNKNVGLRPKFLISDDIDPALFGTIFHAVIQNLIEPFEGQELNLDTLNSINSKIDAAVLLEINKCYDVEASDFEGKLKLIQTVYTKFIKQLFKVWNKSIEKNGAMTIVATEDIYACVITTENQKEVKLQGNIDLVYKQGEEYHILDYKTGKKKDAIDTLDELLNPSDNKGKTSSDMFQVLLYSLMAETKLENGITANINPELIYLPDLHTEELSAITNIIFKECVDVKIKKKGSVIEVNTADFRAEFKQALITTVLNKITDPTYEYKQTVNVENCKYCDYKNICDLTKIFKDVDDIQVNKTAVED